MTGARALFADTALAGIPSIVSDRFSGSFADAFTGNFDPDTGTFSSRQVSLVSGRSKAKGEQWVSRDQLWVSSSEETFDEVTESSTSTNWYGGTDLRSNEFTIARRLSGADVYATVTLYGEACTYSFPDDTYQCAPVGETDVVVDVTWVGEGPTSTSSSSYQERVDGTTFSFRGRFSGRQATVTGEVVGSIGWSLQGADGQLGSQATGNWYKS
jgi:hypothetical protein